jgi:8-oxo-dGTP pyrophosphatase MutT (NUDIX family)
VPLRWRDATIGSVEPGFLDQIGLQPAPDGRQALQKDELGWLLQGELTATLHQLAHALRAAGLSHAWRDEQLAVSDEAGRVLGTVERAVVRPLGIATRAVHLAGISPDGRHWVQQRSLTKPNDPGLWDTLVGGMVPACDSLEQALERETWEEAGLRLGQLRQLAWGGQVTSRGPSGDGGGAGYVIERIDWYRCVVPEQVIPLNQDGEVARFELVAPGQLLERLVAGGFTLEASLILVEAGL